MRYFFDTEFYERPGAIEFISIGIVTLDGREYYAENADFDWDVLEAREIAERDSAQWLLENVRPLLRGGEYLKSSEAIAGEIDQFVGADDRPSFYAYTASYDWVVFCQLFGRLVDLPERFPSYVRDLKQMRAQLGSPKLPEHTGIKHDALADAHFDAEIFKTLQVCASDMSPEFKRLFA